MKVELLKQITPAGLMFSDEQLALITEAVEDYGVLVDEDSADKCGEILDIIEEYFINKDRH